MSRSSKAKARLATVPCKRGLQRKTTVGQIRGPRLVVAGMPYGSSSRACAQRTTLTAVSAILSMSELKLVDSHPTCVNHDSGGGEQTFLWTFQCDF